MIYLIAFLVILHSNISNSSVGLNFPSYSVILFIILNSLIIIDLLRSYEDIRCLKLSFFILILLLISYLIPDYKNYYYIFLSISVGLFIKYKNYYRQLGSIIQILSLLSLPIIIIQISGFYESSHYLNSFFIINNGNDFVYDIKINKFLFNAIYPFNSNQVRPPGIYYSSAIVSLITISYIIYLYNGILNKSYNFIIITFLIIFSGSKSSLLALLIISIINLNLFKRNIKFIAIGVFFGTLLIYIIFPNLLSYNFNYDLFFLSVDLRIRYYYGIKLDHAIEIFSFFYLIISIFFLLLLVLLLKNVDKRLLIAIVGIFLSNLTNFLLPSYIMGLFLLPLLFKKYE